MPPSRPEQTARPPRRGEPAPRATQPQRRAPVPPIPELQAPAALPVDPAQRERVLLLRSFEASPLSKANFCALKGISEATLDAALRRAESEGPVKAAQKKSSSSGQ